MFSPPVSSGKNGPTSLGSGHFSGSSTSAFSFFFFLSHFIIFFFFFFSFFFCSFPQPPPLLPLTPAHCCFVCCLNFLMWVTVFNTWICSFWFLCCVALWVTLYFKRTWKPNEIWLDDLRTQLTHTVYIFTLLVLCTNNNIAWFDYMTLNMLKSVS